MNIHKSFLAYFTVCLLMLGFAAQAMADIPGKVQFMDLQWLKAGVNTQQAGEYFTGKLDPIVRKHGGKVVFVYEVMKVMKGDVKPAMIASMEFPSMEAMQALFKDAEYQKIIPLRDLIFDLPHMSLFQLSPVVEKCPLTEGDSR